MILLRALLWFAAAASLPAATVSLPGATATTAPSPGAPAAPATPPVPTVIESSRAEMVSTDKESTFVFQGRVSVTGTNIQITCDELVVIARRSGDPTATLGKQENFKSLVATGNVRILQGDREALCGRAEVFPGEDRVVLTENPRVRMTDGSYEATGPRMILERGERRAVIEGTPGSDQRPRLALPPLKDLGYEKDAKKKKPGPETPARDPAAPTPTQKK
jgi:lipopolysaccharide export system protein LptA